MSVSEPGKIITPWAESGLKNPIPPAANPATGRAGFDQGFSAINMTAKEAGGIPPFGQDFNGIFYEVTNILRYMQAGGQPTSSSALATAIGGYPKGAMVLGSDGVTLWQSKVDSNFTDPNTDPSGWGTFDIGLKADLAAPGGAGMVGGLPIFVTATKYAGGASAASTSNDVAIIAAINDAIATDSYVYWPEVYEVQGNIPNFHSVRHDGPGGIKRGANTYRVHQLEWSSINQLYCSASGAAGGDGLTSNFPIVGLQAAFTAMDNINPASLQLGLIKLNLAAGTYSKATFSRRITFFNRVEISGPRPSVAWGEPTAIIDGGGLPGIGLYLQGGSYWKVSHIRATNFSGSLGQGITIEQGNLWAYNVRANNCSWAGVNANFNCRLYVSGSDIYGNGYGIRIYGLSQFTVGYDAAQRTIVRDNTYGFGASNGSSGHFDNASATGNAFGLHLENQSRAHLMGAIVENNNIGVHASTSSSYIKTDGTVVSNNTQMDEECLGFSCDSNSDTIVKFLPTLGRRLIFDDGISGVTQTSGYKYVYHLSSTDSGVQYLTSNDRVSLTMGNAANKTSGQMVYVFSDNSWRLACNGVNAFTFSPAAARPWADNTMSFGAAAARSTVVYSVTGTINTSDAREKTTPSAISDVLLDVADDISIDVWKWLSSIREKGEDAARWHFGPIAQQVRDAFAKHALDGCDYGLLCYDKWDDQFEEVVDDEGAPTGEMALIMPAGDRWGIRPDQCLWLKMAAVERRCKRIEDRPYKAGI